MINLGDHREFDLLLQQIRACQICKERLPHEPNPVVSISEESKILIIGQAPGRHVHESGQPWNDKSGERLCSWLGVTYKQLLDPNLFGILPMGFCYPGPNTKGNGDAPPRTECAAEWHEKVLEQMQDICLILLIGKYAINSYLGKNQKRNLTETVRAYKEYLPQFFPLVHPSPLNFRWQAKNPWFEKDVIPDLRGRIDALIIS